jgi:hypothetical protein
VQINAKIGGIPWAINELPFTNPNQFTMLCSFDVHAAKLGFVFTYNYNLTQYHSILVEINPGKTDDLLINCAKNAFIKVSKIYFNK